MYHVMRYINQLNDSFLKTSVLKDTKYSSFFHSRRNIGHFVNGIS